MLHTMLDGLRLLCMVPLSAPVSHTAAVMSVSGRNAGALRLDRVAAARQRGNAVTDLPHGHALYVRRGDGGVKLVQFEIGAVLAAGQAHRMGG